MKNNDKNTQVQELKDLLLDFREKRDWKQFHNPKDLAEAISIEASELLELFLWKTKENVERELERDSGFKKEIEDELADIVSFCLNFANSIDIDISTAVRNKIEKNSKKYPEDKAKGVATKYNKL
jgi:NTP pyrophosphatase (non-canonical NTP hydrolase)